MSTWRAASLLKNPAVGRHLGLCLQGLRLGAADARDLARRLLAEPRDVEARLLLLGYQVHNGERTDESVLWLIQREPEIEIESFWRVDAGSLDAAKALWRKALSNHPTAFVYANAAWTTVDLDPEFAEQVYWLGEQAPRADSDWFSRKAAFFESRMDTSTSAESREHLARVALRALLNAIELEAEPRHQHKLLWPARQYATAANERATFDLLRDADRAVKGPVAATDYQRHLTVLGLVALARGDRARAAALLDESAKHLRSERPPAFALVRALARTGAMKSVQAFLSACLSRRVPEAQRIAEWTHELEQGRLPDMVLEAETDSGRSDSGRS